MSAQYFRRRSPAWWLASSFECWGVRPGPCRERYRSYCIQPRGSLIQPDSWGALTFAVCRAGGHNGLNTFSRPNINEPGQYNIFWFKKKFHQCNTTTFAVPCCTTLINTGKTPKNSFLWSACSVFFTANNTEFFGYLVPVTASNVQMCGIKVDNQCVTFCLTSVRYQFMITG